MGVSPPVLKQKSMSVQYQLIRAIDDHHDYEKKYVQSVLTPLVEAINAYRVKCGVGEAFSIDRIDLERK